MPDLRFFRASASDALSSARLADQMWDADEERAKQGAPSSPAIPGSTTKIAFAFIFPAALKRPAGLSAS